MTCWQDVLVFNNPKQGLTKQIRLVNLFFGGGAVLGRFGAFRGVLGRFGAFRDVSGRPDHPEIVPNRPKIIPISSPNHPQTRIMDKLFNPRLGL